MPLRRMIRTFIDPVDDRTAANLTRQLADFEDNVAAECDDIRATTLAALKPTALAVRDLKAQLMPGMSVGVDTTSNDLKVQLAPVEKRFAGKFAAVFKRVAANNLIVAAPAGTTINGAATLVRAAVGLQLIFCDGEEYWA